MMVHDRYFYDPAQGKYTVDRYLDDLEGCFRQPLAAGRPDSLAHREPQ